MTGFLEFGRRNTVQNMAPHVSHFGRARSRLQQRQHLRQPAPPDERRSRSPRTEWERHFYELALKVSGAVAGAALDRASADGVGYIYSFNGPHSLFVDTIRSCARSR